MIFAHGPWYTEWHHLIALAPAALLYLSTLFRKPKG